MGTYTTPTVELIQATKGLPSASTGWYFSEQQTEEILDELDLHNLDLTDDKLDDRHVIVVRQLAGINAALERRSRQGQDVSRWLSSPNAKFEGKSPFAKMLQGERGLTVILGYLEKRSKWDIA